ncbi:hypothetical protein LWI29_029627 [Acer saccharum]|uniref:Uncharacterized protein n=1 Tax=Acer saccharum TaxID=4024 RepID=A0AA39VWE5_ACESA|nr:hypothetical protein LWI29_029627 [Acer saccharum]
MYNHRTIASFVRSPDDPPSRKKLFDDTDFQTHKAEVVTKSDGLTSKGDFDKHSSDPWADDPADSKMVEDVDNRTILDENELKEINNCVELCIEQIVQKMDANQKANMTEFANLNRRMDAFQKALVHSGLQFPYVRGQTNGLENTL